MVCVLVLPFLGSYLDVAQRDEGGARSEDCLKVNIYAPHGAKEGQPYVLEAHS